MGFFKRGKHQNYDVFSAYSWHVPGIGGMFGLLLWLLLGALLGNIIAAIFMFAMGLGEESALYAVLIAYPVMFIPAMIASRHISNRNMMFDTGFALDSNNFAPKNGWYLALLCMVMTLCASFCTEPVGNLLPPMPEWLEKTLGDLTGGPIWISLLCVSIFAPLFEEWLCRGMVLRGLLNYERTDAEGNKVRGLKPWLAIVVSAAFFAVIHMNPWQAIPAFVLGCIFGYVYWKTGSLKLTMLMHFTNNTFAVILSNIDSLKDAEGFLDIMSPSAYWALFVIGLILLILCLREFTKVEIPRPQGGSTVIPAAEEAIAAE